MQLEDYCPISVVIRSSALPKLGRRAVPASSRAVLGRPPSFSSSFNHSDSSFLNTGSSED